MVFPEGARGTAKLYRERYSLVDFGTGFMRLALQTRSPIVPVAILGTRRILPKGGWRIRPGPIILRFGQPIATEEYGVERRDELIEEVRARVQEMLEAPAPLGPGREQRQNTPAD